MTELQVGNGISIVDFYTDWCGPCKIISESLKRIKEKFGDKLNLIKVNADSEPELTEKFEIQSVPSLFFFKNGELKESFIGNISQHKVEETLLKLFD